MLLYFFFNKQAILIAIILKFMINIIISASWLEEDDFAFTLNAG
jgi:hypothetical protein